LLGSPSLRTPDDCPLPSAAEPPLALAGVADDTTDDRDLDAPPRLRSIAGLAARPAPRAPRRRPDVDLDDHRAVLDIVADGPLVAEARALGDALPARGRAALTLDVVAAVGSLVARSVAADHARRTSVAAASQRRRPSPPTQPMKPLRKKTSPSS
jgi:hypothetical protein